MKYTTYRTNKNCDAFEMLNVKEQEKCAKCKTISTKNSEGLRIFYLGTFHEVQEFLLKYWKEDIAILITTDSILITESTIPG
jgi:hypothetical protein